MDEIYLRPVNPADLSIFFEHQRDRTACVMAAFTAKDPDDRESFDRHWAKILANESSLKRTIIAGTQVAGYLSKFDDFGEPEVCYWIGREHWNKGVATNALRQFLREIEVRPLYARAAADNAASLRVLEKCGFQRVGRDRGFANARGEEIEEVILKLL
jgi:RimJ/RimL family protein N-acetyltransferase